MSSTPQVNHGLLNFFPRVSAIAGATFTELVRMKVFYFLLIFALVIIGNSAFMMNFSFEEKFQMLKDVALGAMSIFTSLLAILATVAVSTDMLARHPWLAKVLRTAASRGSAPLQAMARPLWSPSDYSNTSPTGCPLT